MKEINWWEIGDNQYVTLTHNSLENIKSAIKQKFRSLNKMSKILSVHSTTLWYKFSEKNQSMSISLLKNLLRALELKFGILNSEIESIGIRDGIRNPKFPLHISPYFSELLAHGFFDGYADSSIFRYSNYDLEIRNEFLTLIEKLNFGSVKVNNPTNIKNYVDLADAIPKLLISIFDVNTFNSSTCRIPEKIYRLAREDKLYAWFFIKAAYLDEGTITGGQIFLVRGIRNYGLAKDLQRLCEMIGLRTKIKESNPGGYSLLVGEESYPTLYGIFNNVMFNKCDKVEKLLKKIGNWKKIKNKQEKYKRDLKFILEETKKKRKITVKEVMSLCDVAENMARIRLRLLTILGNLKEIKKWRKHEFVFISDKIEKVPRINDIRRLLGWRK